MQLILEGNSNRDLVRSHGTMSMQQAMDGTYPAIGTLVRREGNAKVEKVLAVMVQEASAYFDEQMGKEKAMDIAAELTCRYAGLRLEDVWVCLNQLKGSEIYGKLTSNKVLAAMGKYTDRRLELAAQQSLSEHLARQEPRTESGTQARFKEVKHQWELEKLKKQVS
jgi:hypothetical protein